MIRLEAAECYDRGCVWGGRLLSVELFNNRQVARQRIEELRQSGVKARMKAAALKAGGASLDVYAVVAREPKGRKPVDHDIVRD